MSDLIQLSRLPPERPAGGSASLAALRAGAASTADAGGGATADDAITALDRLYAEVDRKAAALGARMGERLQCRRGCAGCCVDDIVVWDVEAERIRRAHPELLASALTYPAGGCAFLAADNSCRVHADRPYVCRTQGLPLRWLEEHPIEGFPDESAVYELRDICPLNDAGPPIESLSPVHCWTIGPFEARLRAISTVFAGGVPRRVRLRDLFGAPCGPEPRVP